MNWKLIFGLSLFGAVMAFATVFVIPSKVEPLLWLPIFLISAYAIARGAPGRVFLHGVLVGVANSVWITGAHIALFTQYLAHHPQEAAAMESMHGVSPRVAMACVGPIIGVISGVIIGLFAMGAARILRRGNQRPPAPKPM